MASDEDRSWMRLPRHSAGWKNNFRIFLQKFTALARGRSIACPCTLCQCMIRHSTVFPIQMHLLNRGFADCFVNDGNIQDQTNTSSQGPVNLEKAERGKP
jgi:hypothetical protein